MECEAVFFCDHYFELKDEVFIVCEFCVVSSLSYMYVYIFLLLAFFMCILNVRGMSAREGGKNNDDSNDHGNSNNLDDKYDDNREK